MYISKNTLQNNFEIHWNNFVLEAAINGTELKLVDTSHKNNSEVSFSLAHNFLKFSLY